MGGDSIDIDKDMGHGRTFTLIALVFGLEVPIPIPIPTVLPTNGRCSTEKQHSSHLATASVA